MHNEIWQPIPNTNSMYYISSLGRVYSKHTKKIHRLVAELFITRHSENLIVNHIDGNKTNNHVSNLEWVTYKENTQHMLNNNLKKSFPNNLPNKEKPVLCVELNKEFNSMQEASRVLGIPQSSISKVCRGERKLAGGYTWKYIEGEKDNEVLGY